ncbi:MAG TPA: DUF2652 domain-containing protein, partial [Agromyces sp.]
LEKIIDAAPGFDLIEIEGDAAFLARQTDEGENDTVIAEVLGAAVSMHQAFHLERQYVAANLCPCTGCKGAADLKLKFVAHVGDVAIQTIRDRIKLVGIDVILVHRLLKNPVAIPEYVLLSEELNRTGEQPLPVPVHEVSSELEGFGTVNAYFVDVEALDDALPPLPAPTWRGRIARTAAAAGLGVPYMLGLRRSRRLAATPVFE